MPGSEHYRQEAIVCDGAVRSGKTLAMGLSFFLWASTCFDGQRFGVCGKTVGSLRRNVLSEILPRLEALGAQWKEKRSENLVTVRFLGRENQYYIFGGRDESSASLIQGITFAGILLDEVALMPQSFVEQACARCSVAGSRLWFNCNPAGPNHWHKVRWIDAAAEKNLLYLHFTMDDNLSLSEKIKARYRAMYAGVFYERYIRGLWKTAEGLIYTTFTDANIYNDETRPEGLELFGIKGIACDYGTTNPCVFLKYYDTGDVIYFDDEYRWDSRSLEAQRTGQPQKTDAQYAEAMTAFMGTKPEEMCGIIVDPSAASFIQELRGRGFIVTPANNEVLDGIRKVSGLFEKKKIMINGSRCCGTIDELQSYVWDEKAASHGEDKPVKDKDHGCDSLRYAILSLPNWRFFSIGG